MKENERTDFSARQKASAEAKRALLANFKPKPAVTDPLFAERAAMKAAEVQRVRDERAAAREAKRLAAEAAVEAARLTVEEIEAAALNAKREERKARKAQMKADARARREQRSTTRRVAA